MTSWWILLFALPLLAVFAVVAWETWDRDIDDESRYW